MHTRGLAVCHPLTHWPFRCLLAILQIPDSLPRSLLSSFHWDGPFPNLSCAFCMEKHLPVQKTPCFLYPTIYRDYNTVTPATVSNLYWITHCLKPRRLHFFESLGCLMIHNANETMALRRLNASIPPSLLSFPTYLYRSMHSLNRCLLQPLMYQMLCEALGHSLWPQGIYGIKGI